MQNIRLNINAVTSFHYLLLISYRKFEFSTCHISCLCMIMSMRSSYSSFFKLHFHQHHLSVVSHNLTSNTRTCRFPCLFSTNKSFTARFSYRFTGCLAVPFLCSIYIIRKSKFPQNPKRSVRFSGKRTKRSVQKRKARNTQKAETKVL